MLCLLRGIVVGTLLFIRMVEFGRWIVCYVLCILGFSFWIVGCYFLGYYVGYVYLLVTVAGH